MKPTPKEFPYKITTAFLHQAITWPGVTGGEKTISDTRIPGVKLNLLPQGLLLECKGKTTLIPSANIANYLLEALES